MGLRSEGFARSELCSQRHLQGQEKLTHGVRRISASEAEVGDNFLIACQGRATAKESPSFCSRASSEGFGGAGPRGHHGSLVVIAGMETKEL